MDIFNKLFFYMQSGYNFLYSINERLPDVVIGFVCFILLLLICKFIIKKIKRKRIVGKVIKSKSLFCMQWDEFEKFVAEYFRLQKFSAEERGGPQADGGIDLVIARKRRRYIVQVKQYSLKNKISISVVREMLGVFIAEKSSMKLDGVIIVTSSSFSKPAIDFAKKNNVTLVSGNDLLKNIGKLA